MKWLGRLVRARAVQRTERRNAMVFGSLVMHAHLGANYVYSTDLWQRLGGSSGDIYRALWALERAGLIADWDDSELSCRMYSVVAKYRPGVLS
jgi:hypothetical protein